MEQARKEAQQPNKQAQPLLRCPRCNSLSTRFRYFNNNNPKQPRHHCRTCKRQWTVGGKLRPIPIGGNTRNSKCRTTASSSGGGNSRSQSPQPPLQLEERHQQNPTLMNFDTASFQPITNMLKEVPPLNYFSNQISCSCAQKLIQQVSNQHVDASNPFSSTGTNITVSQELNVQSMAPNAPPPYLYTNSGVQTAWPVNSLAQNITYNSTLSMPNACLQKNLSSDATDIEDTIVNIDEWLNFPGSDL